jgi:16S rRNA (guanine966-N2)-methyltransferase
VRIVAGHLRGRIIPSHRSLSSIRLTASHLKEAVFSMLGPSLGACAFLDLCAGSGQIGMEAHSRGARVTLNEPDQRRRAQIRDLLRAWNVDGVSLYGAQAQALIRRLEEEQQRFDLVYVDPPYHATRDEMALSRCLLEQLGSGAILRPEAEVLVQHQAGLTLPETAGTLHQLKRRAYGNTELSVFRSR